MDILTEFLSLGFKDKLKYLIILVLTIVCFNLFHLIFPLKGWRFAIIVFLFIIYTLVALLAIQSQFSKIPSKYKDDLLYILKMPLVYVWLVLFANSFLGNLPYSIINYLSEKTLVKKIFLETTTPKYACIKLEKFEDIDADESIPVKTKKILMTAEEFKKFSNDDYNIKVSSFGLFFEEIAIMNNYYWYGNKEEIGFILYLKIPFIIIAEAIMESIEYIFLFTLLFILVLLFTSLFFKWDLKS